VPSHVAEGQARSTADFQRFLSIARGSILELETQVIIANRLGYLDRKQTDDVLETADTVSRLITGLSTSLG